MTFLSRASCAAFALATVAFAAMPAAADERICRGKIGVATVDDLKVPARATCVLDGTRVKGTIKVERGGKLVASRVVVIGNVQAEGAASVVIQRRARIGGSVQIVQGGSATIRQSVVDGSIQLESNRGALVVADTTVGADLQAFQNSRGVRIEDNRIDGNLQCKSNRPAPTGGGNTVEGSKEDQCRRL